MRPQRRLLIGALPHELTFAEAALQAGVTYRTVYNWAHAPGKHAPMPAYKRATDGQWCVRLEDLQRRVGVWVGGE
jgi:hypothetical protein